MNEEKFAKYKNAFKIYGAVTHYIFYANRSIVVGFALEGKPPPTRRTKISLVDWPLRILRVQNSRVLSPEFCVFEPNMEVI